jgi:hypothetical protein
MVGYKEAPGHFWSWMSACEGTIGVGDLREPCGSQ